MRRRHVTGVRRSTKEKKKKNDQAVDAMRKERKKQQPGRRYSAWAKGYSKQQKNPRRSVLSRGFAWDQSQVVPVQNLFRKLLFLPRALIMDNPTTKTELILHHHNWTQAPLKCSYCVEVFFSFCLLSKLHLDYRSITRRFFRKNVFSSIESDWDCLRKEKVNWEKSDHIYLKSYSIKLLLSCNWETWWSDGCWLHYWTIE